MIRQKSSSLILAAGVAGLAGLACGLALRPSAEPRADFGDGCQARQDRPTVAATFTPAAFAGFGENSAPVVGPATAGPAAVEARDFTPAPSGEVQVVIGKNESFYEAMTAHGATHQDIMALVAICRPYRNLKRVRRGEEFRLRVDADGRIQSLSFDLDEESYLTFVRQGDDYEMQELTHPVDHRVCAVSGTISASLYASLERSGAPLTLAPKMNDILGWEIDFNRDLRGGDTYRILYEEVWKDGSFVRTGPILALECVNGKRAYQIFRFIAEDGHPGYYDAEGNNVQKQLMRAPLEYSRISSGFSYHRLHPIQKRYKPHLGVDYAAPLGTPVWAAGSGTVIETGRKQADGRYVRIRHNNRAYETYYLHLSRFGPGIRKGAQVQQGQVIGFVGASGYATGPHLDFRVKKNGTFIDPRRMQLPPAEPVPVQARPAFLAQAALYRQTLQGMDQISLPHQIVMGPAGTPADDQNPQPERSPAWSPYSLGLSQNR